MIEISNANLERLDLNELAEKDCRADVLRLDKVHPVISGNKWFKLKYYLEEAVVAGKSTIITFGGAWSNHIVAAACAARMKDLSVKGIIRGERPAILSPTLQYAMDYGMELIFVSRQQYRDKENDPVIKNIIGESEEVFIIPEGGSGELGVKGAGEILSLVPQGYYTHIMCAIGTGTMFTGLLSSAESGQQVIGIPVLKGMTDFENEYSHVVNIERNVDCRIFYEYHLGGYAKKTTALIHFMNEFYRSTGIPTDFVYTGKLMYGFTDLLRNGHFKRGSRILLIHSGGLQGNISVPKGTLVF